MGTQFDESLRALTVIRGQIRDLTSINQRCFQARLAGSNAVVQVHTTFPWVASRGDEIAVVAAPDPQTGKHLAYAYRNLTTETHDLPEVQELFIDPRWTVVISVVAFGIKYIGDIHGNLGSVLQLIGWIFAGMTVPGIRKLYEHYHQKKYNQTLINLLFPPDSTV